MATDRERPAEPRTKGGRFARGVSGNPGGRPAGSRNRASVVAEQMIAGDVEAVMDRLLKMAKKGDRVALRLVVDRVLPRARGDRHVGVSLPAVSTASDIALAMGEIVRCVSEGSMSLEEAQRFAGLLELQRRAIETSELQVRLEALEARREDDSL